MYQRLLLLLNVLLISGALTAQNVMTPNDPCYKYDASATLGSPTNPVIPGPGIISKWVHDPIQSVNTSHRSSGTCPRNCPDTIGSNGFDQSTYKCYFIGRTAYRLRFPINYNPANKYPAIVFLHGAGEAAFASQPHNSDANRENQDQLYWGAQLFEQRMVQGEWNGFLLFPQLMDNSSQWDNNVFPDINRVLDTLQKYNGLDPDRVITMGLSAGGFGTAVYAYYYPQRIASVISANPKFIQSLIGPDSIKSLLQIPIYMACGGIDVGPYPSNVMQFRDSVALKGGNIYIGYNPTVGHSSWTPQWNETDINNHFLISTYWNSAHKAQPLLYFQNSQFCIDSPINAKMGITDGFYAYEWQFNGGGGFTTISGATSNTYTATAAGAYRVHFMRTSTSGWSDWTPTPVVISTKKCTLSDTAFVEHFETTPINPYITWAGNSAGNSPYFKGNYDCQNGVFINSTEVFTQDATGRLGGTFMLNNTTAASNCTYYSGDQVWRTYYPATVMPNTDYTLNFYMGNNHTLAQSNPTSTITQLVPKINGVALTAVPAQTNLVGDISWKKYSYTWNSGSVNYAEIAITNNTATGTGNDFVLDEISLVKSTPTVMPAGVNTRLWAKADKIGSVDGNIVKAWTNNDVNGNNLLQNTPTREPIFKNNSTDNINFNPAVAYSNVTFTTNFVSGGFATNGQVHSSVHAYFVLKAKSISSGQTIFSEGRSSGTTTGTLSFTTGTNGAVTFNAGTGGNLLSSNNNMNDLNKPTLWTLSKDNTNGTGDGNKQDIRKNGAVIATSSSTSTFTTGTNNIFRLGAIPTSNAGTFNGNIAEVIYLMDTTLNAATENKLESYLAVKYGITLGYKAKPVAYTASDGTVIWPLTNSAYHSDVFGIGVDSLSGLFQTTSNSANSGSGDGTGQSARGNLVLSVNAATTLGDKDFLMIGSDSASLSQSTITAGQATAVAVGSTRVGRKWKVVNTGNVGKVDLSFDTTGLNNQVGGAVVNNYALMIDNDGDGNFATGTTTFFTAKSASGKKIFFTGATLNNGVVFTILTNLSTALPAVWLGFTANAVNGDALLNWKTSNEINVDYYVVEHSYNGISFSAIGSVTANNNSDVNNYNYTDKGLSAGIHYYRIRRVDKDGKSEYSETKTVKIATAGANVQIRPNPVVGSTLTLAVAVPQASKTMVQIMSVDGKVLMQKQVNLAMGSNLVTLDVSYVPSGMYLLQVQLKDGAVTQKFIRQH
ncbi:MAG: T9SS type A sorting domain-containing protein [Chitinophagaceae bacterium]